MEEPEIKDGKIVKEAKVVEDSHDFEAMTVATTVKYEDGKASAVKSVYDKKCAEI